VFTGLIGDLGSVSAFEPAGSGAQLRIRTRLAEELSEGDSVAVNGVCLTATSVGGGEFAAQMMAETLERCSLRALREGAAVNLELPLRLSDRLGGHLVQGHVDGTGTVVEVRDEGSQRVLGIEADEQLTRYLVERGSVALDGVSLTVSALGQRSFEVSLVDETRRRTNLGDLAPGDAVNIELDMIAKHIMRLLEAPLGEVAQP
jgi:riboflavin synthase